MYAKPVVLETTLSRFTDAGLQVSVIGSHLLLHDVPVVDDKGHIQLGVLVSTFIYTENAVTSPVTHQVWFDGPFPCDASGKPLEGLRHSDIASGEIAPSVPAKFHFSNKDEGWTHYESHFDQLMHYWRLLTDQVRVIDPMATQSVAAGGIASVSNETPFRYPDACSARGNFMSVSQRLAQSKVAIIGLGGTGSYILDQLAKTPVQQIHLFDGDEFEMHNAYRAPGAAPEAAFGSMKVDYFAKMYDPMRRGIVPHPDYITEVNGALLGQFDFVFVSVDKGPARKLICGILKDGGIPFIDCGMDLAMSKTQQIYGTCRATLCTPEKNDHLWDRIPTMEDAGEALYAQNIQIADANAFNALLAVMRWKQHLGFYASHKPWHQLEYMIDTLGLAKSVTPGEQVAC